MPEDQRIELHDDERVTPVKQRGAGPRYSRFRICASTEYVAVCKARVDEAEKVLCLERASWPNLNATKLSRSARHPARQYAQKRSLGDDARARAGQ